MCRSIKKISEATVVILAGGRGARLSTIVHDRPKVLAEVCGKPFMAYLLDQISAYGIGYVVLCTGYMGDQVKSVFGDKYANIKLDYSHELSPLGTGGALKQSLPFLKSNPVLVMNGDSICRVDLKEFWKWHLRKKAEASILLVQKQDTGRYGQVRFNNDCRVLCFEEKAKSGPGWINAGVYIISTSLIDMIPKDRAVSLEKEVIPVWIGGRVYGYLNNNNKFLDIGTPDAFAGAKTFLYEKGD